MRNASTELLGHLNIKTGKDDISQKGELKYWNYKNQTSFFPGECGKVNGSAGEMYPPKLTNESVISLFTPDLCRSLLLDFEKEVEVNGLKGYKFVGGLRSIDNGTLYPENICFCNGDCVPSGVLNVSSCRFGTPAYTSYPHYYNADPFYLDMVEGLNPVEEKHQLYIILEPVSLSFKFQENIY